MYSIAVVLFSAASRCRLSIIQQLFYRKLTFWTHQKLKFSVEAKKTERGHGLQSILFFGFSFFSFSTRKAYMQQKMRLMFVSRCYTFTAHWAALGSAEDLHYLLFKLFSINCGVCFLAQGLKLSEAIWKERSYLYLY